MAFLPRTGHPDHERHEEGRLRPIKVTVSNTVARDNICSLAKKRKRTATAQRVGDDFVIEIA